MKCKGIRLSAVILCLCTGLFAESRDICAPALPFSYMDEPWEKHPVFSHNPDRILSAEKIQDVDEVLAMSDDGISAILPKRSGVFFVGCPNCTAQGWGQDFDWSPGVPDKIVCRHCKLAYPNAKYPENGVQVVTAPSGKKIEYKYYENSTGRRYYFGAGVEYRKKEFFKQVCYSLALHSLKTGSEASAHTAAVIICGLAQAYPDFVYKFDFPNRNVIFYDGVPSPPDLLDDWRSARWSRWAYGDSPRNVMLAYDAIFNSAALTNYAAEKKIDLKKTVEEGFFRAATEGAFANREVLHNMSPAFWQTAIMAGRVARCPEYVHLTMARFQKYLQKRFFFDGFWSEASVSYFQQSSALAFDRIFLAVRGYSDPDGYVSPYGLAPFKNYDPEHDPALNAGEILNCLNQSYYPNGFVLPMGDSWMLEPDKSIWTEDLPFEQQSYLQAGVGHACLATPPNGNQTQLHLFWTPKNGINGGHHHSDTLSLTLFAEGQERLSDLGYTHTHYKRWAKSSVSHNLITVDYENQPFDKKYKGRGNLIWLDKKDSFCQLVETDGAYANHGNPYRRTLFLIENGAGGFYAADFFTAGGGTVYDYFLHGNADTNREDEIELVGAEGKALELVPGKPAPEPLLAGWREPANEAERLELKKGYAYGFLTDTARAGLPVAGARLCFAGKDGVNTFVHIPSQGSGGAEIFTGRNCTARVKTDNSRVCDNHRKFMMLRQSNVETAHFSTVIETCRGEAGVKKVERPADNILRVTLAGREDIIFLDQPEERIISCGGLDLKIQGRWGWVSVKNGQVDNFRLIASSLETPRISVSAGSADKLKVSSVENGNTLVFAPETGPFNFLPGDFLVVSHGSELRDGYFVKSVDAVARKVTVEGRLGFELIREGVMAQTCYPLKYVMGDTMVTRCPAISMKQ